MTAPRQIAILVEGQTEESFVSGVLAPHLIDHGTYVTPIVVATARPAGGGKHRGGGSSWQHWERDLRQLLGASHFAAVTTLIDFYGYPSDGPGFDCCARPHDPRRCVEVRQDAMAGVIDHKRFVPYVVLHEFETWVIAAAVGSGVLLGDADVTARLQALAAEVGDDVELLNDSPETAPSKRIHRSWPDYNKPIDGVAVVGERGLPEIVKICPALAAWLEKLI